MPLISSLQLWASRVSIQRFLPALLVGRANSGTMMMPMVASTQFSRYMITSAAIRVMLLERILVRVLVMTSRTPVMSLVMRVMMSP